MFSATSHVAQSQSSGGALGAKKRQKQIIEIIDQITAQAKRAASFKLPNLSKKFSDTLSTVSTIKGDTPEYLAMVVLSRALQKIPSWINKLDKLCVLVNIERAAKLFNFRYSHCRPAWNASHPRAPWMAAISW